MTDQARSVASLRAQQNFALAVPAGIIAAIIGAGLWTTVTVLSGMKLGLIAIAVGFVVGQAIRWAGRGLDPQFGILGALCALFGCALGNVMTAISFFAKAKGVSLLAAISLLDLDHLIRLVTRTASPMDVLFYGIAIYEGYKFSFAYRRMPAVRQ